MRIPVFLLFALLPGVAFAADDAVVRRILGRYPDDPGTASCGPLRVLPAPGRTSEGLALDVVLDESELTPQRDGDADSVPTLAINVVLTNRSRTTRHLAFPESCAFDYVVRGPGGQVIQTSDLTFGCWAAEFSLRLRPGERTVERVHWTGRRVAGEALPPGRYGITGVLRKRWCGGEALEPAVSRPAIVELRAAR